MSVYDGHSLLTIQLAMCAQIICCISQIILSDFNFNSFIISYSLIIFCISMGHFMVTTQLHWWLDMTTLHHTHHYTHSRAISFTETHCTSVSSPTGYNFNVYTLLLAHIYRFITLLIQALQRDAVDCALICVLIIMLFCVFSVQSSV